MTFDWIKTEALPKTTITILYQEKRVVASASHSSRLSGVRFNASSAAFCFYVCTRTHLVLL
jgi:hypothetical protein